MDDCACFMAKLARGGIVNHAMPEQERALITFIRDIEDYLSEKGYIQAVGFRYVGQV
jgi:hypothetical protein